MVQELPKKSANQRRLWLLLAGLVALTLLVRFTGLSAWLDQTRLQALVDQAGPWGPLAFVAVFVAAVVAQVPGMVFVFAAPALFQPLEAFLLCFVASMLAVIINFELVRKLRGKPAADVKSKWLRSLFAHLHDRPVRTIALLRVITIMFPPVTSALALTPVSSRDHALGSALGMALPIAGILYAVGFLIAK